MQVDDLRLWGDLRPLSALSLLRLLFGFARVKELSLQRISGNQLTDEDLHECGRRQISRFSVLYTREADAEPLAVSDEGVLDYLFAPEHAMPDRRLVLPSFNASPQFVQKLVEVSTRNTQQVFTDAEVL